MNPSDCVPVLHPRPQLFMLQPCCPHASRHVLDRHKFPGGRPPYKSNFYCHPGRAGGTPMLLDCAKDLLNAAGAPQLIGPGRFTTGPAVSNHLEENPLSLCCQDEFGSFLNGINKTSASRWE